MLTCPHCKHEFEPLVLDGAKPKRHTLLTFSAWIESLNGEEAIPSDHAVMRYAESVNLPEEFVAMAWVWFEETYGKDGTQERKRYKDWRAVFLRCVRDNWPRLWWINNDGEYQLTASGRQRKIAQQQAAA